MSDFEDVFGPGVDISDYDFNDPTPAYVSPKERTFRKKKKEFNQILIKLGFKWCLKHRVIHYPKLHPKAVFLDRVKDNLISRMIIEPCSEAVVVTIITTNGQYRCRYNISEKNAFKNAMLIAMDFKFSLVEPFFNATSMMNDKVYIPLPR